MLQHIRNDIRQIVLCHQFLFITQLSDTHRHPLGLLRCQFQSQFLKVLGDIRLSAVLTQRIFALTTEPFWLQEVIIETSLVVAVGMDTSHLREHVLTNHRLIGCNGNAAVAFHQPTDIIQTVLMNIRLGMELVLEDYLHTRQRCITTTFTQTVHRDMQSFTSAQHRCQ